MDIESVTADWDIISRQTEKPTGNLISIALQMLLLQWSFTHSMVAYTFRNRTTGESRMVKGNSEAEARATLAHLLSPSEARP
jgi:hypothetical protein